MEIVNSLRILGLSRKEERVLLAIKNKIHTPLLISRATKVSRTAVYAILINLKKRGIITTQIRNGKKSWMFPTERELDETIYEAKKVLLNIADGREEVHGVSDSTIVVHRGEEAIKILMQKMLLEHKGERLYGFQGNVSTIGWNKIFSLEDTNKFNRAIKKNGIIVEAMLPNGWFEQQTKEFGIEWAKDFEGRATRVNVIGEEYFKHGAQLYLFKDSIYLNAHNEMLVIEIRHSDIQKMLLSFFRFMQENSQTINANAILQRLIAQGEVKK